MTSLLSKQRGHFLCIYLMFSLLLRAQGQADLGPDPGLVTCFFDHVEHSTFIFFWIEVFSSEKWDTCSAGLLYED